MKQVLLFADTEDFEITEDSYPNMDAAYNAMDEAYQEQLEFYDNSVADNGIDDDKAFVELDDGRRMFWNIK